MVLHAEKESSLLLNHFYRQMYHWRKSLFMECLTSMKLPVQLRLKFVLTKDSYEDNFESLTGLHKETELISSAVPSIVDPSEDYCEISSNAASSYQNINNLANLTASQDVPVMISDSCESSDCKVNSRSMLPILYFSRIYQIHVGNESSFP